jgi:hypothetical protein
VADKVKDSIPKINYSDLPTNVQNSYKKYSDIKWEGNFKGQTEGTAAGKNLEMLIIHCQILISMTHQSLIKSLMSIINYHLKGEMEKDL